MHVKRHTRRERHVSTQAASAGRHEKRRRTKCMAGQGAVYQARAAKQSRCSTARSKHKLKAPLTRARTLVAAPTSPSPPRMHLERVGAQNRVGGWVLRCFLRGGMAGAVLRPGPGVLGCLEGGALPCGLARVRAPLRLWPQTQMPRD